MYGIPCHVYSVWIIAKVSWTAAKLISQFYNYRQLFLYPLLSLLSLSLPIIIIFFKLSPIICVLSLFLLIVLFLWIIYCHFFRFLSSLWFSFFFMFSFLPLVWWTATKTRQQYFLSVIAAIILLLHFFSQHFLSELITFF